MIFSLFALIGWGLLLVLALIFPRTKKRTVLKGTLICIILFLGVYYHPIESPLPNEIYAIIDIQPVRFAISTLPDNVTLSDIQAECNKQMAVRSAWKTLTQSWKPMGKEGMFIYFSNDRNLDLTETVLSCSCDSMYGILKKGNQRYWLLGNAEGNSLFSRLKSILIQKCYTY